MIKLILSLLTILLSSLVNNTYGQSGWIQQSSGTTKNLTDVFFMNTDTGLCCGEDVLLKTMDSGINWNMINIPYQSYELGQIHYFENDTILITGDSNESPFLLKSINGGNSWDTIKHTVQDVAQLGDSFFINSKIGWALIQGNIVYKTTNGGKTWIEYSNCINAMHIFFLNKIIGFSCQQGLSKTTDGGKTWHKKQNALSYGDFHGICFIDENTGWVAGCAAYKTTDGGETWKYLKKFGDYSNPPESFKNVPISIHFIDSQRGWACGFGGTIYHTTNGGDEWNLQNSGTEEMLHSIFFIDDQIGYAVGENGIILKTESGGWVTGIEDDSTPINFSLYQNYPNPFNPRTVIRYSLPVTCYLNLSIYNLLGQKVITLIDEFQQAGKHQLKWQADGLPSGIYFARLQSGTQIETLKLILQK